MKYMVSSTGTSSGFAAGMKGVAKAAKALHDTTRKVDPRGPILDNLFTGKKGKAWPALAIMAGAVAVGVAKGKDDDISYNSGDIHELSFRQAQLRRAKPGATESSESPMMLADAMQNAEFAERNQQQATNADTLGTNGSMVFGMHDRNQGGYL